MTRIPEAFVGAIVAERFELLQRLGEGGMGTVWRARDLLLDREVALKEMRSSGADDAVRSELLRERVGREARALAKVRHPNVVAIHEVLDQQPYPWLVMEMIDGRTLRDVLHDGPLTPARTARVALDVLGALQAAHQAGVLHRDVKPSNVLIRPDGTAVLTDFGIATLTGSQTLSAPGDLPGSPEYMAPERIRGARIGPASDLWSLGMLMYVCVEGANPVQRDSLWHTLRAVCDQPVPPPARAGALAPTIHVLLSRQPARRPGAQRLAEMLTAVAEYEESSTAARLESATMPIERPTLIDGRIDDLRDEPPKARPKAAPAMSRRRMARRGRLLESAIGGVALASVTALVLVSPRHHGRSEVLTTPPPPSIEQPGSWIVQLSEIPHTADADERDTEVTTIQQRVPGASLLDSDEWASLPPGQWIVRAPGDFASGYDALEFCAKQNLDQCSGRFLSKDSADRGYLCEADPAPDPATCRRQVDGAGRVATRSA